MREAKIIYQQTRPARWPAQEGTNITVTAKLSQEGIVAITWERDGVVEKGGMFSPVTFAVDELQAIAAAAEHTK